MYKKEADTLRAENAALQNKALASPRTKAAQASNTRIQELEQLYSETLAKVEELGKEAEERESYWRNKLELMLKAGENAWNLERTQLAEDRKQSHELPLAVVVLTRWRTQLKLHKKTTRPKSHTRNHSKRNSNLSAQPPHPLPFPQQAQTFPLLHPLPNSPKSQKNEIWQFRSFSSTRI